jgi:hypothetical protein
MGAKGWRVLASVLIVTLAALGTASRPADAAVASDVGRAKVIQDPDYAGRFGSENRALLKITKVDRRDRPIAGAFQAVDLEMFCESGPIQRVTTEVVRVRFHNERFFSGDDYDLSDSGYEAYKTVRGKLSPSGRRIRGKFLQIEHSAEPNITPGCATDGYLRWRAKRSAASTEKNRRGPVCPTHRLPGEKAGDRFDAGRLVGKTVQVARRMARRHDCSVRVVKRNGQLPIVSADFNPFRINVAVRDHRIKNVMGVD